MPARPDFCITLVKRYVELKLVIAGHESRKISNFTRVLPRQSCEFFVYEIARIGLIKEGNLIITGHRSVKL